MVDVAPLYRSTSRRGGSRVGSGRKPAGRFIYVLQEMDDPGVCKIGVTHKPKARLSCHQVSTWRPLMMAGVLAAPSAEEAWLIKQAAHKALATARVTADWFRVTADQALAQIVAAAEASGVALVPFDPSRE
jgi:hypothetical protein